MRNKYLSSDIKNYCIGVFFVVLAYCIYDVSKFTKSEIHATRENIASELSATNKTLNDSANQLSATLNNAIYTTDSRMASIERNTLKRVDRIHIDTFKQLDMLQTQVAAARTDVNDKLIVITEEVKLTSEELRKPVIDLNGQFLNCDSNDLCLPNLLQDTMIASRNAAVDTSSLVTSMKGNIESISEDVNKVSGVMTTSLENDVPKIVSNVTDITENIARLTKPKWYDRLLGAVGAGSMIWFNFNRASVVTK